MTGLIHILQNPVLILLAASGTFCGVYVGAIPGLSGTMAISLLVSFTYGWETENAVALMIGVFVGVVFGGSRSAILLNIPGAPAAVATGLDGYPLARKGKAGIAMGTTVIMSFIGTLFGTLILAFAAPLISKLSLAFKSIDYLLLAMIGLIMTGSIGRGQFRKSMIAALAGIMVGMIGMDPVTAVKRFTYGNPYFNGGVDFIVALIGLFGVSEALLQIIEGDKKNVMQKTGRIIPPWKGVVRHIPLALRCAVIGTLIGALPGAGGDIASIVSYNHAKRTVKKPETPFGEGAMEGLVAPETANNAAIGGALIPMLTLGIPGDAVTGVLIGALSIHGLRPGPGFLSESPDVFRLIIGCLLISSVFLLIFGLSGIRIFVKLTEIPKSVLIPIVIILSIIGSYTIRNNAYDIIWMFVFGVIGCLMKRNGYPVSPMVLGLILSDMFESNLLRWIKLNDLSAAQMIRSFFRSPISIVLLIIAVLSCVSVVRSAKDMQ